MTFYTVDIILISIIKTESYFKFMVVWNSSSEFRFCVQFSSHHMEHWANSLSQLTFFISSMGVIIMVQTHCVSEGFNQVTGIKYLAWLLSLNKSSFLFSLVANSYYLMFLECGLTSPFPNRNWGSCGLPKTNKQTWKLENSIKIKAVQLC